MARERGVDAAGNIRPGWWVTKDDQHLRIAEMRDGHLLNTIRFLQRQSYAAQSEAGAAASYCGNPDGMGAYYAEHAMLENFDLSNAMDDKRGEMIEEAKKRKIWKGR